MYYHIDREHFQDFHTIEVNRLPARSYFIPYPAPDYYFAVPAGKRRYASPMVKCLNGEWDFKFFPKPGKMPENLDTDLIPFDKIKVPGCIQFQGYDKPFYVNYRYQFPYDPPRIPTEEPVGKVFMWMGADKKGPGPEYRTPEGQYNYACVYRTFFDADDMTKLYTLSFLGVASCADVYVNGTFAGYTEGSHNTAEFDVTTLVREGRNELLVVVRRWCNGSYLECQDMFRNVGIFRDVLLRINSPTDLWDIEWNTVKNREEDTYSVSGTLTTCGEDTDISILLEGIAFKRTLKVHTENGRAFYSFENLRVCEWTAEDPTLYNLYVKTPDSCVVLRVGFKDIQILKNRYLLNGRLLKMHGVNHHDTSPTAGYTMTPEEIQRDVELCKEYNIDTIRTSHYPPDPYLLELCDEKGIYVVDEADLETHGVFAHRLPPSYNRISNDSRWEAHYMDRVKRLYQRDKLHASIMMWSLGNEAGGYQNQDKMYEYLKKVSNIPVHYESAIHSLRKAYDIASEMYPPAQRLHETGLGIAKVRELNDRPYFLCEYAHAMGVGPGNIESYWKEIYAFDNNMGGCVWEMVDHAVLHEDGTYTYGGDHGEWEHDGNFCVDGLFYPDRRPSTGARIVRHCYRPLRFTYEGGERFSIFNTRSFRIAAQFTVKICYSDGTQEEKCFDVFPLKKETFTLPVAEKMEQARKTGTELFVTFHTLYEGQEVAREQILLVEKVCLQEELERLTTLPDTLLEKEGRISYTGNGVTLRSADPYTILYRAATDNDKDLLGVNLMEEFYDQQMQVESVTRQEGRMVVLGTITCKKKHFTFADIYQMTDKGLLITSKIHCTKGKGFLPRFGKTFCLPAEFDRISYFGRDSESYADMKEQAIITAVETTLQQMTEPNIKPQESGNRCDCRYATVKGPSGSVTFEAVDKPFELGIKPYSDVELLHMKHREDELTTGCFVTIQGFQMGIGTGSCGPGCAPEYTYPVKEDYEFSFLVRMEDH
ncbi:MAG: hypothetical protein K5682_01370 [Lachnospiraceae bacterium]|nr:hypothetical protein [Lachnospiraceae bacterium]